MKIKKYLPIIFIVILGFILRFYHYAQFPVYGESQDELAWTWMGSSILQGHHPTSWSGTGATGYWFEETKSLGSASYRIVTPYLDNPHLFSLIPGAMALLKGYKDAVLIPVTIIRFPMLLLGVLNIFLLYFAIKKWTNQKTAILASALYATIPTIVFTNRLVAAENLLVTWMLISWILLYKIIKERKYKLGIWLGIVGGLSGLTKIAGLVVLVANTLILMQNKLGKVAKKAFLIGLAIFALYPLYGLLANSQLFIDIIFRQSQFNIGMSSLINLFIYPKLIHKTLIDGWIYFGLFSLIILLFKNKLSKSKTNIFNIYALLWFGFLIAVTDEVQGSGWYRYPLFPLMTLAMSQVILKSKQYINSFIGLYLFVWLPTLRLIFISREININPRPFIFLGFLPLLFDVFNIKKSIQKKLYYIFILILIITNIIVSVYFNKEAYWRDSLYFYPIRSGE
jgi:4-amino-4-deoxy-L-arabinose transferase-like glycosyltransferase